MKTALVLGGGAARGAYEVGVIRHIVDDVARSLGREVPLDLLCGTSIGALNVCGLAAWADEPRRRAARLEAYWRGLDLHQTVRIDAVEALGIALGLFGLPHPGHLHGGLLDPEALQRIVRGAPFERIGENLRAGHLAALTVSTTHVSTGRTHVFIQRGPGLPLAPFRDPWVIAREAVITADHALASAAIPIIFAAIKLDGDYHVDGSLRQNTPILPARLLGASAMVVVNAQWKPPAGTRIPGVEEAPPGPLFLIGKALDALLLDHIDTELDQLARLNLLLAAGAREFGPDFAARLALAMGDDAAHALRPLHLVRVRASQNIGHLAAEYVRSADFQRRHHGLLEVILRRLADGEASQQADFLSYLLFDGEFARVLIELGKQDAEAQHEALCSLFDQALAGR